MKRDFADGQYRMQLRVVVGDVSMGPVTISVYDDNDKLVYALPDDQFTLIAQPIVLHDFKEGMTQDDYQTGIGADGTIYVAIDTTNVSNATTYTGSAVGFPLRFDGRNVAFFNDQGFLMGFLDPKAPASSRSASAAPTRARSSSTGATSSAPTRTSTASATSAGARTASGTSTGRRTSTTTTWSSRSRARCPTVGSRRRARRRRSSSS
jgi:hypothetical protein